MYTFERILIALDLSDSDEFIYQQSVYLSQLFRVKKAYFVHITRSLAVFDNVTAAYPDVQNDDLGSIKTSIDEKVRQHYGGLNASNYEVLVQEAEIVDSLGKLVKEHQIDLVVLGRKATPGLSAKSRQIIREAACSIAFLPNLHSDGFRKVITPLDFSDGSKRSLQTMLQWQKYDKDLQIFPVNVYEVPLGYSKTGKSFEEFAEIMKGHAQEEWGFFKEELDASQPLTCEFILDKRDNHAKQLFDYALMKKGDLIVIGSKGRTRAASLLLGSVAVKLLDMNCYMPMIIVKNQQKNMGFLQALFRL